MPSPLPLENNFTEAQESSRILDVLESYGVREKRLARDSGERRRGDVLGRAVAAHRRRIASTNSSRIPIVVVIVR